jgi:nucleoid DNA-binding protein
VNSIDLATRFGKAVGMNRDEAMAAIKQLFKLITEVAYHGDIVRIGRFGRFSLYHPTRGMRKPGSSERCTKCRPRLRFQQYHESIVSLADRETGITGYARNLESIGDRRCQRKKKERRKRSR